ncbi:hypothetical protein FRC07_005581 [Ceratobasidium sp. 392]|nr:hypothetical protein FRC07_005581 [Ceratobasidium sp. 392]
MALRSVTVSKGGGQIGGEPVNRPQVLLVFLEVLIQFLHAVLLIPIAIVRATTSLNVETEHEQYHGNSGSTQAVVAVPVVNGPVPAANAPIVGPNPQVERACPLSFFWRWLLFFVIMRVALFLASVNTAASDIIVDHIVKEAESVVKTAAAVHEVLATSTDQCGVSRLLETLYEVCTQVWYVPLALVTQ